MFGPVTAFSREILKVVDGRLIMESSDEELFLTQTKTNTAESLHNAEDRPYFELFSDISDGETVSTYGMLEGTSGNSDVFRFSDVSESELISTCEKVEKAETSSHSSSRFACPKSDPEISALGRKRFADSTMTKIRWAVKTFKDWQENRNRLAEDRNISHILTELEDMTRDELNYSISRFLCEAKKLDGSDYPPDTLYTFVICLQLYFDTLDKCYKFLIDDSFSQIRNTLDNVMKINSKQKKQAQVITLEEEEILWSKGCLGLDTPSVLLDTLVYSIGLNFALRGGQEHRDLRRGSNSQFEICQSVNGRYLKYTEKTSKTNNGGLKHRRLDNKCVVAYENLDNVDRCVVNVFEKYCSHCPTEGDALYLRPLGNPKGNVWYSGQPLGRHTLGSVISRICKTAGLTGYRTNHSLRATAASRLYEAGVDEQLICEVTGHRSVAVRNYKRSTEQQKQGVSKVLQGKLPDARDQDPHAERSVSSDRDRMNVVVNVTINGNSLEN